jgi:hypothetical protein
MHTRISAHAEQFLFVPSVPISHPRVRSGPDAWMLVPDTMVLLLLSLSLSSYGIYHHVMN